jgi:Icc-related predicted phosphoesterase
MRVLALADKPLDAVFCLGDLDRAWIESLASLRLPRYGVHGNHDPEQVLRELDVEDLHMRRTQFGGVTVAGFEGCVRYSRGATHQYSQREAARLARRLPAADVLLCHCPPLGINDDPEDPAHIGFEGLRDWVDRHRPRHLFHGHTHPLPGRAVTRHGDTRVHWISGARVLELA